MGWIEALILGIVQGLTEYLPVSSSGHIEIVGALLGRSALPEENLLFTVLVHVATALSTIVVFRQRIAEIFKGLFSKNSEQWQFAWMVVISMIPAALVGVLLEDQIVRHHSYSHEDLHQIAIFSSSRNFDILAAVFTEVLDYMHDDLGLIPSESIQSSDANVNEE